PYAVAMTELDTRPVVDPQLDDGDDDQRFSHYVRKEDILRSAVDGVAVTALCGKKWLPGRDPEKYPVCPQCKELMGMLEAMG
ncbi:MAG: putative glycerophosphodiester phosphodiesterase, partial [Frankiales bacterium]|nr:putative glycerophosphodiester phosphodiesterase [Frankiales bacterium]